MHATCDDDMTFMLLVFAQVFYKSRQYVLLNVTPSLLPLRHRVVGSHQQTKHKEAQTKTRKQNEKQSEKRRDAKCNRYQVTGTQRRERNQTRKSGRKERAKNLNSRGVAEIFQRTNRKQAEGRNGVKRSNSRGGVAEIFQRTQKTKSIWWVSVP